MPRVNRDTIAAIALLVITGVFLVASFDIRQPDYGQLSPAVWPRIILVILAILSFVFLIQSLRQGPEDEDAEEEEEEGALTEAEAFAEKTHHWRNVLWCFALFLGYLLALPWLGMLVGGMAFVFLLLSVLGGWQPRMIALHAAIAVVTVGGMWSLFTYALGVFLPQGELTGI